MRRTTSVTIALLLTVSVRAGRLAASASSTPVTASVKDLKVSAEEIRIRLRGLIRPVLGIVEQSADEILATTDDPVVRRGALVWKIETTTTLLAAMLRSDPVLALADAWGYTRQVGVKLARPETKARFGESASRAAAAMLQVEGQFRDFVADLQGVEAANSLESVVRRWAEANPIEGALYRRPAMNSAVAAKLASSGGHGIFSRLRGIEETATDLTVRTDLYTMYMPKLARWEAELAADDLARGLDPATLSDEFTRLARAVDRMATVAETAPDLARGLDPHALAVEFTRLARAIDRMAPAVQTAPDMTVEVRRLAGAAERIATVVEETPALSARERTAAVVALQQERFAAMTEMERLRGRLMVDTEQGLERVVDHAFYRFAELLLIAAVLLGLSVFLLRRGRAV